MLPPEQLPPVTVAMNTPPQSLFGDNPMPDVVSPPIYSPEYPSLFGNFPAPPTRSVAPPGITPEPSTWMLLATSMLAMGVMAFRRQQMAEAIARR